MHPIFPTLFVAVVSLAVMNAPFSAAWRIEKDPLNYHGKSGFVALFLILGVVGWIWVGFTGLALIHSFWK